MSRETGDNLDRNLSDNPPMASVMDAYLSRRSVMRGSLGAAIAMIAGTGLAGCLDGIAAARQDAPRPAKPQPSKLKLGFESIAGSRTDACVVAAGYSAYVLAPWGTPLNSKASPWKADGSNTALDQANAMGMHHDGMHFFPIAGSADDGLLAINFEYIDPAALHPNGPTTDANGKRPAEEVRKEINAHGVGVVRLSKVDGRWQVVENDPLNRRFTTASRMNISGPLRGTDHVKTRFSPDGSQCRGTNNNCGNGHTPWGTYLTCEENWPGIFVNKGALPADQSRIGVATSSGLYQWESAAGDSSEVDGEFARFDVTPTGASATDDYRNEASTYGYIVEIDPYDSTTLAVKRTALGRFRHEGCCPGLAVAGKPLVWYSGDDSNNEYLYKFVSDALWDPADANPADRLATGDKYLDQGTLYVARFDADGRGSWLPLDVETATTDGSTLGARFGDLPSILLNTRGAADAVGATPMDRPEWTAVNPLNGDVYLTLTNNSARTPATVNAANPRGPSRHGHIIRWRDSDDQRGFTWDIFVFGANASGAAEINRSGLTELNQFASPDGMCFDSRGVLWFETDNSEPSVADYTNDQLLAVIPSDLMDADGRQIPVNARNQVDLRRFFVGPNGCEVTGIAFTPDNKTLFINIQHPGNWPYSDIATDATPAGTTVRPRASTVVIQRDDGGEIGTA
ncbi:PhoX family phosphatase [Pseudomonas sp. S 311-6]|uniref:PhoX family protein n=1 Tax=Pseudomonas TaxID=286 RepID=UPI0020971627|nr:MULTISPECIES: PhoX family phosphatase [Pseudomonas]MCO7643663.1 PhoX family phosphatase [Pseudomonas sp. S 311-6]MCO7568228.1 PhoX family phosphatase [Pseudomonas mosselii]MCO7593056.1 PhoX family phosphatase [Pseudomonas guariconensis]MCO7619920.1 PhoX family phosphatase [Pseudomonas guariconensis]MCO7631861.1 PhoX family phosphatase [Pseudomonas guariconensis]